MPSEPTNISQKKCVPCEGGIPKLSLVESQALLLQLPNWQLTHDGTRIRKACTMRHFQAAMEFLNRVAELAEAEGHHPDLHLESYRQVWIEIWTHAIGGLSENDFILAAQIEQIPKDCK